MRCSLLLSLLCGCLAFLHGNTLEEIGQVPWLDQELHVETQELTLTQLLKHIADQVDGLALSIDPDLEALGQDQLWLFRTHTSIRELLQMLTVHGSTAAQHGGSVFIAQPDALIWTSEPHRLQDLMQIRSYAVGSLLSPSPPARLAELGFRPAQSQASFTILCGRESNRAWDIGMLQAHIEDSFMPALWLMDGGAGSDIRQGGILVIRHLPSIHERIAAMLAKLQIPDWSMRVQVIAIESHVMLRQGDRWREPLPQDPAYDFWLQGRVGERVSYNAVQERRYPAYASVDEEGRVRMRQGILTAGLNMHARLNPFPGGYVLNYAIKHVDDLGDRESNAGQAAPQLASWMTRSSIVLNSLSEQPMVLGIQTAANGQRFAIVATWDAPESPPPANALPTALTGGSQEGFLAQDVLLAQAQAQEAASLRITAQAADLLKGMRLSMHMPWNEICSLLARNDLWLNDDGEHWLLSTHPEESAVSAQYPLADLLQPSSTIASVIAPLSADPQMAQNPIGYVSIADSLPRDAGEIVDRLELSLLEHEHLNMTPEFDEDLMCLQITAAPFIHRKVHHFMHHLRAQSQQRIAVEMLRLPKNHDLPPILSPQASAKLLAWHPLFTSAVLACHDGLSLGYQRHHSYRGFHLAGQNILPGFLHGLHYQNTGLSMSVTPIIHADRQHISVQAELREASDPEWKSHIGTESPHYRYHNAQRDGDLLSGSAFVIHGIDHSYVTVLSIIAAAEE